MNRQADECGCVALAGERGLLPAPERWLVDSRLPAQPSAPPMPDIYSD
jgi:hypothetical protein